MTVTEVVFVRNFLICVRWAILHWTRRFAKVNVNKVDIFYGIVLILVMSCFFRCTLSLYWLCVYLHSVIGWRRQTILTEGRDSKLITWPTYLFIFFTFIHLLRVVIGRPLSYVPHTSILRHLFSQVLFHVNPDVVQPSLLGPLLLLFPCTWMSNIFLVVSSPSLTYR